MANWQSPTQCWHGCFGVETSSTHEKLSCIKTPTPQKIDWNGLKPIPRKLSRKRKMGLNPAAVFGFHPPGNPLELMEPVKKFPLLVVGNSLAIFFSGSHFLSDGSRGSLLPGCNPPSLAQAPRGGVLRAWSGKCFYFRFNDAIKLFSQINQLKKLLDLKYKVT